MTQRYILSEAGVELIKRFEGFRDVAYKDFAKGIWTVGYGSTVGVKEGMRVNKQQAMLLLINHADADLVQLEKLLNQDNVKEELFQSEVDALAAWMYNFGFTNFRESSLSTELVKYLQAESVAQLQEAYDSVAYQWRRWVKARVNGEYVVIPGLQKRREEELALFHKGFVQRKTLFEKTEATTPSVKESLEEIKRQIEALIGRL